MLGFSTFQSLGSPATGSTATTLVRSSGGRNHINLGLRVRTRECQGLCQHNLIYLFMSHYLVDKWDAVNTRSGCDTRGTEQQAVPDCLREATQQMESFLNF